MAGVAYLKKVAPATGSDYSEVLDDKDKTHSITMKK